MICEPTLSEALRLNNWRTPPERTLVIPAPKLQIQRIYRVVHVAQVCLYRPNSEMEHTCSLDCRKRRPFERACCRGVRPAEAAAPAPARRRRCGVAARARGGSAGPRVDCDGKSVRHALVLSTWTLATTAAS